MKDENNSIIIKPKTQQKKAYLNISGRLEGELKGTILGDTVSYVKSIPNVKRRIYFAYKQNCMSVLMSAIDGSNFENKWVYAHHTTTFKNNYLIVYLLERYAEYLVNCEIEDFLRDLENFFNSYKKADEDVVLVINEHTKKVRENIYKFLTTYLPVSGEEMIYDKIKECIKKGLPEKVADQIYEMLQISRILNLLKDRRGLDEAKLQTLTDRIKETLLLYSESCKFYNIEISKRFHTEIYEKYIDLGALEIQCFAKIMTMFTPHNICGDYFYRTDIR